MDPPLVGESSFSAANPSSYSLAEIWSFPINGNGREGGGLELRMGSFSGFGEVATNRDVSVDESTVTEQSGSRGNGGGHGGRKKREANSEDESSKLVSTSSGNDLNDSNGKPMKVSGSSDGNGSSKAEVEASSGEDNKPSEQVSKPSGPPKDYIHVRDRRALVIDGSLAERVRTIKISERMKILQDLVPGCNKVIGKALVLDEIINYIQSLQRKVEFLSMKLEAVNSRLNPTMEGVPLKDLVPPTFDVAGMIFGSQAPREYAHVSQPEWLHMQTIEGESGLCNKGTVEALDSVVIDAMDVFCNCGTMAVLKTSWTNQNPGRRFYTCGKSMAGRCGFFVWCDPPMCLRARQIIPGLINHISTVENQLRRRRRREICLWIVLIILWLFCGLCGAAITKML